MSDEIRTGLRRNVESGFFGVCELRAIKLEMQGVRAFASKTDVPLFRDDKNLKLLTISGPNGSGKSAIVDALSIIQSAGLLHNLSEHLEQDAYEYYSEQLISRIENLITTFPAYVKLHVSNDGGAGYVAIDVSEVGDKVEYKFSWDGSAGEELVTGWSKDGLRNVVVTVPSTKYIEQDDIFYTQLRDPEIDSHFYRENTRLLPELYPLLLDPSSALRESYRNLLEDWFFERIVPGKKRTYINTVADLFLEKFFPDVSISKFSATQKTGQIVCMVSGKGYRKGRVNQYDVRGLSSGEKYIYFLFSALARYAGNTLIAVFDEPENHLHESTLSALYDVFYGIADRKMSFIEQLASVREELSRRKDIPQGHLDAIGNRIGQRPLATSFIMATHAKSLIRRNLSLGSNLLIADGKIVELGGRDTERKLRRAGVSQVDERVVFVEGETDESFLMQLIREPHTEIRPLNGKGAVCNAFEGFVHIDSHERHPGYVFLLDGDSTKDFRYKKLMEKHPEKWGAHVVLLEKTELENYLLEPEYFRRASASLLSTKDFEMRDSFLTNDAIAELIFNAATKSKLLSERKFLAEGLVASVKHSFPIPKASDIPHVFDEYQRMVMSIFREDVLSDVKQKAEELKNECAERFSDENWKKNWRSLCKGKAVLNTACDDLVKQINIKGVNAAMLKYKVWNEAVTGSSPELSSIANRIRTILGGV